MVNIAFSGGIDSTYLLVKAFQEKREVNIIIINASGNRDIFLRDMIACRNIITHFENLGEQYRKLIRSIEYIVSNPFPAIGLQNDFLVNSITQQFSVMLGMLTIRRKHLQDEFPSTWIGWIKEDSSDHSFVETDHSIEDYQALLNLPKIIGPLSNSDNTGTVFRAPCRDMQKFDMYNSFTRTLQGFVIPNAAAVVSVKEDRVISTTYDQKLDEYAAAGIPAQKQYSFSIEEHVFERLLTGYLKAEDLDLPSELTGLVRKVAYEWVRSQYAIKFGSLSAQSPLIRILREIKADVFELLSDIGGVELTEKYNHTKPMLEPQ